VRIGPLLAHLDELETAYAEALRQSARWHADEHDVVHQCLAFAVTVDRALATIESVRQRYDGSPDWKVGPPDPATSLLEQLRSLHLRAHEVAVTWAVALQAAKAARDSALQKVAAARHAEADMQARWFLTRIKTGAPQALVVD
jgi:hypothetical protein